MDGNHCLERGQDWQERSEDHCRQIHPTRFGIAGEGSATKEVWIPTRYVKRAEALTEKLVPRDEKGHQVVSGEPLANGHPVPSDECNQREEHTKANKVSLTQDAPTIGGLLRRQVYHAL